jgi:fatty acid desaturase
MCGPGLGGNILQVVAWSIAVLVLAINMYLLGVSVFTSIVESVQVIAILGVLTVLYVAFICYLILEPAQADGNWSWIKNFFSRKERQQILEHVVDEPDDITVPLVK